MLRRGEGCLNRVRKGCANGVGIVYRTNTFPLIHNGIFHTFLNLIALAPLLERFEAEYGTLTSLALFVGRELSLCPGGTPDC